MKNSNGYLKKTLLIFSILSVIFLSLPKANHVYALEGFDIQSDFNHVWDGTKIDSTVDITISTSQSPRVITFYTIVLPQERLKPVIYLLNKNKKLEPTYYNGSGTTSVVVDLDNAVVSKDKPISLRLSFSTLNNKDNLSLISSILDSTTKSFTFTYPSKYGDVLWSSTPVNKVTQNGDNIEIQTTPPTVNKVNISLGEKIFYEFHISRNLLNTGDKMISSEISIPPNTNTQKIVIDSVEPQPDKAYTDIDGNYILQYEVAPKSNIEVYIKGYIDMEKTIYSNLSIPLIESQSTWDIKDTDLEKRISKYVKENIGADIQSVYDIKEQSRREVLYKTLYQFIINNLEPNTLAIGSLNGFVRLGGERALSEQSNATSEDYADATISLFRKYKIPARLVIGYITDISDYHENGMYNYWIEYMDVDKKDWVIIDPFLEDYSKNSLYGRTLPDHVTLLYRYDDPNIPKLSYYSENDFIISSVKSIPKAVYEISTNIYLKPYKLTDSHLQGSIAIKNMGNTVIDKVDIVKSNPDITKYIDQIENNSSILLLPKDITEIKFNIPSLKIDTPLYSVIKASSGTHDLDEKYTESTFNIINNNAIEIFSKIASITIFVIISGFIYILLRKKHKND